MTVKERKEKALQILKVSIGTAYYKLESEDLSEEDVLAISEYINKYGTKACKAIGLEYVSY